MELLFGAIIISAATVLALSSTDAKTRRQLRLPIFNAKEQQIDVTGKHKFVPPNVEAGDQRGPCPGLNALANHGYLPHNGVGTIAQFIEATNKVFGLGNDVAVAVSVYGAVMTGDGRSWSIGGPPKPGLTGLAPGLLGPPLGITFSHNTYEGDASATRPDLYLAGNDYKVDMQYFKQLYDALPASSIDTLSSHRKNRVETSVKTNPYFFSGPFTGIAVSGAANSFVYRLAANHSEEYPAGILTKETLASFWSVRQNKATGELKWKSGWDRIPDNWYRRPLLDPYDFPYVAEDFATYFTQYPETVKVGGNMGKPNTFMGLDLTNATAGVFNAEDFAKGNNAACFAFQAATLAAPDMLSKIWKDISAPLNQLEKAFTPLIVSAGCRKLQKLDTEALKRYPGYSKLNNNGTY